MNEITKQSTSVWLLDVFLLIYGNYSIFLEDTIVSIDMNEKNLKLGIIQINNLSVPEKKSVDRRRKSRILIANFNSNENKDNETN